MTLTPYNAGWIEVICGSMFSGKTEELIRRLRRAEIAQLPVVIFKPKVDNRFSKNFIVSHNKTKMKSIIIENVENIISQSKEYDVIGVSPPIPNSKVTEEDPCSPGQSAYTV